MRPGSPSTSAVAGLHTTFAEDLPSDGERITGEELYAYLQQQHQSRKEALHSRQDEYTELSDTLEALLRRSRHRLLAPVAGGLGYFDAELHQTNTILVLLGEGWFAERSVHQAKGIVERRLAFLKREEGVLREEIKALESKAALFHEEFTTEAKDSGVPRPPNPLKTVNPIADSPAAGGFPSAPPDPHATTSSAVCGGDIISGEERPAAPRWMRQERPTPPPPEQEQRRCEEGGAEERSTDVARLPAERGIFTGISAEELATLSQLTGESVEALTTLTEADELEEAELMALEEELMRKDAEQPPPLQSLLEDDDYVEKCLTEAVLRKKEKALRARLETYRKAADTSDANHGKEGTRTRAAVSPPNKAVQHAEDAGTQSTEKPLARRKVRFNVESGCSTGDGSGDGNDEPCLPRGPPRSFIPPSTEGSSAAPHKYSHPGCIGPVFVETNPTPKRSGGAAAEVLPSPAVKSILRHAEGTTPTSSAPAFPSSTVPTVKASSHQHPPPHSEDEKRHSKDNSSTTPHRVTIALGDVCEHQEPFPSNNSAAAATTTRTASGPSLNGIAAMTSSATLSTAVSVLDGTEHTLTTKKRRSLFLSDNMED